MSDMIVKQLVHEKTVLFNRVNMIEKDLTKARITIDALVKKQEEDRYAIKELVTACNMLRLRVEKVESNDAKLLNYINDCDERLVENVNRLNKEVRDLDQRTRGSIKYGI